MQEAPEVSGGRFSIESQPRRGTPSTLAFLSLAEVEILHCADEDRSSTSPMTLTGIRLNALHRFLFE